ncbi:hypothetical protein ACFVJ8_34210 [Streptomyces yangpuensis]|uniref:hypothetical protein n=1 Tax=Streptomyces yangpuensis TaxID=1648182 RepID=UPI003643C24B
MLARSGDVIAGTTHARGALDALPAEKHSLTLRLLMAEVEQMATALVEAVELPPTG